MPVTARLSKAFYDQFGEQVTNELVEWFNLVDLTYRTELRTLNDTNFARFEALLDSRFARADLQLERQLNARFSGFEHRMEKRFGERELRSGSFEQRIEQRLGEFEQRMDKRSREFDQRVEKRFGRFDSRLGIIEREFPLIREELRTGLSRLLVWMIGLWIATTSALLAVLAR
jgi:hypothetical protein